jgi:hypothetical protein
MSYSDWEKDSIASYSTNCSEENYDPFNAEIEISSPNCASSNDGICTITLTGGVGGSYGIDGESETAKTDSNAYFIEIYNYDTIVTSATLADSVNIFTATNLAPGTYTIIATDALSETIEIEQIIEAPDSLGYEITTFSPTCYDSNDGGMEISVTGGTAPYYYSISSSPDEQGEIISLDTNSTVENLTEGTYFLWITDANGCQISSIDKQDSIIISNPDPIEIFYQTETSCDQTTITPTVTGSDVPYQISLVVLSGEIYENINDSIWNVANGGTYILSAINDYGCEVYDTLTIDSVENTLALNISVTEQTENNVLVIASGGTAPYSIILDGETVSSTTDSIQLTLTAGTYIIEVIDEIGCTVSDTITINQEQEDVYSATISVTDGNTAIENATVYLTNTDTTNTTDANGQAIFSDLAAGTYIFTVSADGYYDITDTITITSADVSIDVVMEAIPEETYSATISVTNGDTAIIGAQVTLGNSTAVTNNEGLVTFNNLKNNSYTLYIRANGYDPVSDSVIISGSDVTIETELTPSTYSVFFTVLTQQEEPINGATVEILGYDAVTTNSDGLAEITNISNANSLTYSVKADGYNTQWDTLRIAGNDITKQITLLSAHKVHFVITNSNSSDSITGATVKLNGYGSVLTNSYGVCSFSGVIDADSISYTVSANGYDTSSGKITVNGADTEQIVTLNETETETYSITFIVKDTINVIEGANISLSGYGSKETDATGKVIYENVYPENSLSYSASANDYELSIGYTNVSANDTIEIEMTKIETETYSISFEVTNGNDIIENALVSFGKYGSATSNSSGIVTFSNVEQSENITYSVYADNFYLQSGTVNAENDSLYSIELESALHTVNFSITSGGNPFDGAIVMFGKYGSITTGNNGTATFDNIPDKDSISYCVYTPGYEIIIGKISVSKSDVSKVIELTSNTKDANLNTYNVNFTVLNGTLPVENASIYFGAYGSDTTDTNGKSTFSNVEPASAINYCANISDYGIFVGATSVTDSDIDIEINIATPNYTVEFYVNEEGSPIEGATISLQHEGSKTTDADGKVTYIKIDDKSVLSYCVSASGYEMETGSISVNGSDLLETIVFDSGDGNSVSFIVEYGDDKISGATVSLSGYGVQTTNDEGIAVFDDVTSASGINYSVMADNYKLFSGTVDVDDTDIEKYVDLSISTYNATFIVSSATGALNGANVYIDGFGYQTTDENGTVTFSNIPEGTDLDYEVTATTYKSIEGNTALGGNDISTTIELEFVGVEVTFTVVNNSGNPIENAAVTFNGQTLYTNSEGVVVFSGINTGDSISYSVSYNGYTDVSGNINVSEDGATETVKLLSTGVNELENVRIKVYPNPAYSNVYICSEAGSVIEIYTISGKRIKQFISESDIETIDINSYKSGIYLIRINNVVTKLIVSPK